MPRYRQRRWGIGLFALALLVASLSGLPRIAGLPLLFLLYPVLLTLPLIAAAGLLLSGRSTHSP